MKNNISRTQFMKRLGLGFLSLTFLRTYGSQPSSCIPENLTSEVNFNCILTPSEVPGPFNLGAQYLRQDIREGLKGFPVELSFKLLNAADCSPIKNAIISLWQADANGVYSGVGENYGNVGGKKDTRYLRGYQTTDPEGAARFKTLFPGWYDGRVAHIHYEVILEDGRSTLVSQIYFPPALEKEIFTTHPFYSKGENPFTWENDFVISGNEEKAKKLIPAITRKSEGIKAEFTVGIKTTK